MKADFAPVTALLQAAHEQHAFPAAAIEVGRTRGVIWQAASGRLTYDPGAAATAIDTLFDLASLTKVIATTPLVMRLVADRRLLLNAPLWRFLPGWNTPERAEVRILDLLEHSAGLQSWAALYAGAHTPAQFADAIAALPLEYRPRSRSIYSDLGFLLLGFVVAETGRRALDEQFADLLGGDALRFNPPRGLADRVAPTEDDRHWRGRLLVGEVHDENAAALGGVAGHAGLFGSAPAVGAFARRILQTLRAPTTLGEPWLLRRFLAGSPVRGSSRALGWDLMRPTSSCGARLSRSAFGHTGFTGTSLWIDPVNDLYVVLLTNRVHPQRPADGNDLLKRVRPAVHDAVVAAVGG